MTKKKKTKMQQNGISVIGLLGVGLLFGAVESTLPVYEVNTGLHCYMCPNGTKVKADCAIDWTDAVCEPCDPHYYQDEPNKNKFCKRCFSSCPKNGYEARTCTATTDRHCICNDGYHRFPVDPIDPHFDCIQHSKCGDGEGEVASGNHTHNTVCRKCQVGQEFVSVSDPEHPFCQKCTECSGNMTLIMGCTLYQDAECHDNSTSTPVTNGNGTQTDDAKTGSGGLSGGGIAGIVITILVVVIIIVILGTRYWRHKKPSFSSSSNVKRGGEGDGKGDGDGNVEVVVPMLPRSSGEWSKEFITGPAFRYLSLHVGNEWQGLIRNLPGWSSGRCKAVIDHKQDEEKYNVPNQIIGCLNTWSQECPEEVTKKSIVKALGELELKDVEEALDKLAQQNQQNGAASNGGDM